APTATWAAIPRSATRAPARRRDARVDTSTQAGQTRPERDQAARSAAVGRGGTIAPRWGRARRRGAPEGSELGAGPFTTDSPWGEGAHRTPPKTQRSVRRRAQPFD